MQTISKPINVLLVDDERQQFLLIGYLLSTAHYVDYHLIWCQDIDDGLHHIEYGKCDVVLFDYHCGLSYTDFMRQACLVNSRVPVIVMTDDVEREVDHKAISEGASDYLVKDHITADMLERTIRYSIERKTIEQHLEHLAHYDHLTDLPNRSLFLDRLNQCINLSHRSQSRFTLMYIDLNDFKVVNDSYGHDTGDRLLQEVSRRLQAMVRKSDTVARIGGDEFTILLNNVGSTPEIVSLSEKLIENIQQPFTINERLLTIGCSIGIAVYPDAGETADSLQRHADIAMYQAKQLGNSAYQFYTLEDSGDPFNIENLTVTELKTAIRQQKIDINFTPRISLSTNQITAIEVNTVWRQVNSCNDFLSHSHNHDVNTVLTRWLLEKSLEMLAEFYQRYHVSLVFSIDYRQLQSTQFSVYVRNLAEKYSIAVKDLEFFPLREKTNVSTSYLDDCVDNVANIGAKLSLDEFGESAFSLSAIHRYDVPVLQLDKFLLQSAFNNKEDARLIETLIFLAHRWQRIVIADNVVTKEHQQLLRSLRCDEFKGDLIGKNLSLQQLNGCMEHYNMTMAS